MRSTETRSTTEGRRLLVPLAALTLAAACGNDEARVQFSIFPNEGPDPGTITIRFDDGGGAREVGPADFQGNAARMDTRAFSTRTSGTLVVDVRVADGSPTGAGGRVEVPLHSDWIWGFDILLADHDPASLCLGCFGSAGFPVAPGLRTAPADSLWVVRGGNSIRHPVVY